MSDQPELVGSGDPPGKSALARAVGRPKGSKNSVDKHLKKLILHQMAAEGQKTPLEFLTGVYSMPLEEAIRAGCQFGDVLKVQVAAAKAAAPYFHSAMPGEKPEEGRGAVTVGIFLGDKPATYRDGKLETVDPSQVPEEIRAALAASDDIEDADITEIFPGVSPENAGDKR